MNITNAKRLREAGYPNDAILLGCNKIARKLKASAAVPGSDRVKERNKVAVLLLHLHQIFLLHLACAVVVRFEISVQQSVTVCFTFFSQFHLTGGIIIYEGQVEKILTKKKPTLVCKDTAQAVWSNEVLATKSFSGAVAPKQWALGEKQKQPLTPQKVEFMIATMKHRGTIKGVDISEAVRNVPQMLTEKIQDVKKALRKFDVLNAFKK
ncbi:uncharacterized protein LOC144112625 [Amblyomma americanum]